MRSTTVLLALGGAAVLAAAPMRVHIQPLYAQGASAPADTGARRPRSPIARLIARRQRLGLTDAQVARLTEIDRQLAARNGALRDSIRGVLGLPPGTRPAPRLMTSAQRQAWRDRMRALAPVRQRMRDNARAAMDQVRATLTSDQRVRLRRAMRMARWRARAFAHRGAWGARRWRRPWGPGDGGRGGSPMAWRRGGAWRPGPGGSAGAGGWRGPEGRRGWRGDTSSTAPRDSVRSPAPPAP